MAPTPIRGVFGSFSSTGICSEVLVEMHVLCESFGAEHNDEFDKEVAYDKLVLLNFA